MSKYQYTENSREISGFGGGYEKTCRDMVIRGMEWFDENPAAKPEFTTYKGVTGIINPENPEAKKLTDVMLEAAGEGGCTGAMMQACIGHVVYAKKNGWDQYIKEMEALEKD